MDGRIKSGHDSRQVDVCGRPAHPRLRLLGAFGGMHVAVDHLKVGHAPIRQQRGPRGVAHFAPDAEQRHPVVDLGGLPQPPAGLRATPRLQAPEQPALIGRRAPQPPRHHAGGVPHRPLVRPGVPQVAVPAEAIDRLAAHAAGSRAAEKLRLAIRRRRIAECRRQALGRSDAPGPAGRRAASRCQRPRQTVGADGVGAPIAVDRQPRHRRRPALSMRVNDNRRRENAGQGAVQALQRAAVIERPCLCHSHAGDRASKA